MASEPHPAEGLLDRLLSREAAVAVVGLGYVGLPLALCLARRFRVVGFDVDRIKIAELSAGRDPVGECGDAAVVASGIAFSDDVAAISAASFIIIAVPTPIDDAHRPDLSLLFAVSRSVGAQLRRGAVVVFESTTYPGCTRDDCIPVLEAVSGLVAGRDFAYGYSPERVNPGDRQRTIDQVVKVVAGMDAPTLELVAGVYGAVITAGIHRAPSVEVAEAAKVIENTQRDLNIALMNELALIFHRLGLDTRDVLEAAGTKWNFLRFEPGLVGGHCIGVDPYYLTHRAERAGYLPQVILAGRRINDGLPAWIAQECIRLVVASGVSVKGARVLILGFTFKEDCRDVRNTRVIDIVHELRRFGLEALVVDPVADAPAVEHEYGLALQPFTPLPKAVAAIVAVRHRQIRELPIPTLAAALRPGAPVLDVKGVFDPAGIRRAGLTSWRL